MEVTLASPLDAKMRVRTPGSPPMDRLVNRATPELSVVTVTVPPSVPPPDFIPAVTATLGFATTLPDASTSWTVGCIGNRAPGATNAEGWVTILRPEAAPADSTMVPDVAPSTAVPAKFSW